MEQFTTKLLTTKLVSIFTEKVEIWEERKRKERRDARARTLALASK